ncbi:PspA/IM30 family protein [Entomomonas sp. E2T0]|uniref:PspA/IM30 family protein n=1 Tax=Entomomonas sp. E2T0 TaxID=2930213 RepID=UPI0022282856|nr:PspA/IM30 family protein [Entomomonas sp. E2T0]UYZ83738.1 PspA/IM30 family protein [Entomomonas sp. E2T0]
MGVWSKLITALRGGAHEAGEAIIDTQALRILDQEIRDADAELRKSKEALAEIMAKQKLAAERVKKTQAKIDEYEGYAFKALEAEDEKLAHEVAEKIANLEAAFESEREAESAYSKSAADLRKAITQSEANIKRLKQQVDTVKATESVQKAQATVASRYSGSQNKMHTALESLERIKKKQAERSARMEAASEIESMETDDALDSKLREAGFLAKEGSANDVLERLKKKQQAKTSS